MAYTEDNAKDYSDGGYDAGSYGLASSGGYGGLSDAGVLGLPSASRVVAIPSLGCHN